MSADVCLLYKTDPSVQCKKFGKKMCFFKINTPLHHAVQSPAPIHISLALIHFDINLKRQKSLISNFINSKNPVFNKLQNYVTTYHFSIKLSHLCPV